MADTEGKDGLVGLGGARLNGPGGAAEKGCALLSQIAVLGNFVMAWFEGRRTDEEGTSLVEYALLLALVVAVAIGALVFVGGATSNLLNNAGNAVANHP